MPKSIFCWIKGESKAEVEVFGEFWNVYPSVSFSWMSRLIYRRDLKSRMALPRKAGLDISEESFNHLELFNIRI